MKLFKKFGTAAACLAVTGMLGIGSATADPSSSVIDASRKDNSSITIIKHSGAGGDPNTGASTTTNPTLDGAEFTVKRVKSINGTEIGSLDYTKAATWQTLAGLVNTSGQPIGAVAYDSSGTTKKSGVDGPGKAIFSNLSFGLYEISETKSPDGALPIAPFYVTLPLSSTTTSGSTWLYDPVIHPKNTIHSIEKNVDDTGLYDAGDDVVYRIETSLSKQDGNTKYIISDTLSDRLKFKSARVHFKIKDPSVMLTESTDYDLTQSGQNISVAIKGPGFNLLSQAYAANIADKLVVEITATVKDSSSATAIDADLENTATFVPSKDWNKDALVSNKVVTKFGSVVITKIKMGQSGTLLPGAKFKIFKSLEDAKAGKDPLRFIEKGGSTLVTETTTGADGKLEMHGLRSSVFENNATLTNPRKYYLVETKAPDGYALPSEPIEVVIDGTTQKTVENSQTNIGFELPSTGSIGFKIALVCSLLLISGSTMFIVSRRRRRGNKA